ncbi:hypothetical protein [Gimesia maris]|uniref:hypothetical protein n=1 Tax=Gimesia maris TaxID=122 RepID=UPI0030DA151D|tara:strand:- start:75960 stop:76361 length:402 start_codon:yes stop_codon:yes gene_type:complete
MLKTSLERNISTRTGLLLLLFALVVPVALWLLFEASLPFLIAFLIVPLILMAVWHDLGFLIGGIFFWGTQIVWEQLSMQPGQIDNMLPGLVITLGWVPYVIFYGPIFLLNKSNARYREKWAGTDFVDVSERLN